MCNRLLLISFMWLVIYSKIYLKCFPNNINYTERKKYSESQKKTAVMLGLIQYLPYLLAITMLTGKPSPDGEYTNSVYITALSLLPPVIAIGLALFTKEVYTSLLAGILAGALLYANGNLELMLNDAV